MIVGPDTGAFYLKKQSYNISLQLDRKAECCAMKDTLQKLVQLQDQDKKDYEAGISMLIEENGNLQTIDRNNQVMLQSKDKQIKRLKKEKVGGIILAGIIAFLAGRL